MSRITRPASLVLLFSLLAGCVVVKVNLTPETAPLHEQVLQGEGREKILLMDITGMITTEEAGTILSASKKPGMVSVVREQLDRARTDKNVKALVIRINSPGGGVTASDMLYHEIMKFKDETGTSVVAHFTDTGTSGAYYTALAADRITAQPTTITGSIGVTMLRVDATGLMEKIGINALHISSGPGKGMGSPFQPATPEETKVFQVMIDDFFSRFVNVIVASRKMPAERVRQIADGRIYASSEAKALGLIDDIGYLDGALELAAKLAKLDKAKVIAYQRPGEYRPNIYSLNMNLFNLNMGDLATPGMKFTYLWIP